MSRVEVTRARLKPLLLFELEGRRLLRGGNCALV